ncbi:D-aminoacyl-tRNA deacylase [Acholeplasma granularum]|uniref:D-aminoacyl-tRNA deacylase n=1 Tax=Acholeplasma granularum TaxID=264635 RepID=UPI00046FBA3B|nr:D-aminoacyl-tRNA deacylase [Acholeplasma granularum]
MRMLVTKVSKAKLTVDNQLISQIGEGYVVYFGVKTTDNEKLVDKCVRKLMNLRIYHDENDKLNLSLNKEKHQILVVSQFTLYGDATNNNRPSFTNAARPEHANLLYESFVEKLRNHGYHVQTGVFGAHMTIDATYVGPFNLMYEIEA